MRWPRAVISGLVIVGVAFVVLVVIPDLFLTQLSGVDRSSRVAIATLWFMAAIVGLLWGLRRLQSRRII